MYYDPTGHEMVTKTWEGYVVTVDSEDTRFANWAIYNGTAYADDMYVDTNATVDNINVATGSTVNISNNGIINTINTGSSSNVNLENRGIVSTINSGEESRTTIDNTGIIGVFNTGAKSTNEITNDSFIVAINTGLGNHTAIDSGAMGSVGYIGGYGEISGARGVSGKSIGLGVMSSLIDNVGTSGFELLTALNSLFDKQTAIELYNDFQRDKGRFLEHLYDLSDDDVGFYSGRLGADIVLTAGGIALTIGGIKNMIIGAIGVGGGAVLAPATGGTSILVAGAGAATVAVGAIEGAAGLSLSLSAFNNAKNDYAKLAEAIKGGSNGGFKKYSPEQIEKNYGLKKGQFHREVKDDILSDLTGKNSPYKDQMKKMGNNPDIYLTPDGQIQIVSREFKGKSLTTDLNIKNFLP